MSSFLTAHQHKQLFSAISGLYSGFRSKHLEKKACPTILVGRHTEQTLGVQHQGTTLAIVGCPDPGRTRRLKMGRLEHLGAVEQGMIQRVRLAVAGVAKNRHDLHWGVDVTA